jgi:spore maturation protein CgeB
VHLTQWAANAEHLYEPLPAAGCRWDVSFVGTAYGNRLKWIASLKDRGIRVECFGHGWENGPVAAETIPQIIRQSRISLNFGDSNWMLRGVVPYQSRQIKARVFEVPGSGGFLMTEYAPRIAQFYQPQEEIVAFTGIDELTQQIHYYLGHAQHRDRIANAGFRKTRDSHTYDHRFDRLLGVVDKLPVRRAGKRTVDQVGFDRLANMHRPTKRSIQLRRALVVPCNLVWGRSRGPRAARRILFELYWRLCGKKTYSAYGLPGRLFYRES